MHLSSLRPLITAMFATLLAFGNAPAWMHRGYCDNHDCGIVDSILHGHGHGVSSHCSHSIKPTATATQTALQAQPAKDQPHDSSTCCACQSAVAGESGSICNLGFSILLIGLFQSAPLGSVGMDAVSLDNFHLRGPPILSA